MSKYKKTPLTEISTEELKKIYASERYFEVYPASDEPPYIVTWDEK